MNVDTAEEHRPFTAVEFCAGYAGIHLGLKRAIPSLRVIAFSEIEAFPAANLVAKMEAGLLDVAPIWTDLKTFPGAAFRSKVDILVGGYPCQPFSAAGKRLGTDDPRHLWPFIREQVALIQPRYCFFENVDGHISMGLSTVLSDLEEDGYRTTWGVFSAAEVGAPHQRKRVFILAHRLCDGSLDVKQSADGWTASPVDKRSPDELAHNQRQRIQELGDGQPGGQELTAVPNGGASVWPSRPGEPQHWWEPGRVTGGLENPQRSIQAGWSTRCGEEKGGRAYSEPGGSGLQTGKTQPPMGRDLDGSADRMDHAELYESCDNRVDELRLLGNGVVPACAEKAWRVLYGRLADSSRD